MRNIKPILVANWKMNGLEASASTTFKRFIRMVEQVTPIRGELIIAPPYTLLYSMNELIKNSNSYISLAAQDCSYTCKDFGPYTGEISAAMLRDAGCKYVILGHSERRKNNGENYDIIKKKTLLAHELNLIPILCVGETLEERDNKTHFDSIKKQIDEMVPETINYDNIIIAYEPVWSIGTGITPKVEEINEMHQFILAEINQKFAINKFENKIKIIYGGSVNSNNIDTLLSEHIDGFLIGKASMVAEELYQIMKSMNIVTII